MIHTLFVDYLGRNTPCLDQHLSISMVNTFHVIKHGLQEIVAFTAMIFLVATSGISQPTMFDSQMVPLLVGHISNYISIISQELTISIDCIYWVNVYIW